MNFRFPQKLNKTLSFTLGVGIAISVGVSAPRPASAIPLQDLIIPGIRYFELYNLSTKDKIALGREIDEQVRNHYKVSSNAYVTRVGQRVASASDCSQIPFKFYVVQDKSINAFSTTGGYVYVNTGLLQAVDNEDQLAAVLGHEIGHICNNDLVNKLRQTQLVQGVVSLAGLSRSQLAALAYKVAVDLPNSREAEFNADAKGLEYITRAGYDPKAMPAFLRKLLNQLSVPTFLSDHPGARERIAVLEKKIASSRR
jgi:predicted Zn-dependent protease